MNSFSSRQDVVMSEQYRRKRVEFHVDARNQLPTTLHQKSSVRPTGWPWQHALVERDLAYLHQQTQKYTCECVGLEDEDGHWQEVREGEAILTFQVVRWNTRNS
jgi:hypothetical protein